MLTSPFAIDYLLLVFVCSLAIIQIAATFSRLNGLLFVKQPLVTRAFGAILIVGMFTWFFTSQPRNLNDREGGLDANYQGILFSYGALAAVVVTLVASSLLNSRMRIGKPLPDEGLDALRKTSYYSALREILSYWWKNWRTQTRRYFFG